VWVAQQCGSWGFLVGHHHVKVLAYLKMEESKSTTGEKIMVTGETVASVRSRPVWIEDENDEVLWMRVLATEVKEPILNFLCSSKAATIEYLERNQSWKDWFTSLFTGDLKSRGKRELENAAFGTNNKRVSLNIGIWSHWEELCATVDKVWDAGSTCGYLTSPTTDGWVITSGPKIYIRPRYHELLKKFVDSRSKFAKSEQRLCAGVVGTSGIGKSNFLQFLLVFLVHEARATRSVISIRVTTMDSNKKASNCYLLFSDGSYSTNTFETSHSKVDYHLSDSVDIGESSVCNIRRACFLASSEKSEEYGQFFKLRNRFVFTMPMWSYNELLNISPFPAVESKIRYEVFGGSARHFLGGGCDDGVLSASFMFIGELFDWCFGDEFAAAIPSEDECKMKAIICNYIQESLCAAKNRNSDSTATAIKSLMWHSNDNAEFFFASRFMALLAGEICGRQEDTLKEGLKRLTGMSGCGTAFENLGHKKMLAGSHCYKLVSKVPKGSTKLPNLPLTLNQLALKKFRDVSDIGSLTVGTYGMPSATNFALIDAVIQPDVVINYTAGNRHKGGDLKEIRAQLLERDPKKHKLVWIVEDPNTWEYQTGIGDIQQYAINLDDVGHQ
jgi:hypothetical protein